MENLPFNAPYLYLTMFFAVNKTPFYLPHPNSLAYFQRKTLHHTLLIPIRKTGL